MDKLKYIEQILLAISTLIVAAKSIVKFIGYIVKFREKPDTA